MGIDMEEKAIWICTILHKEECDCTVIMAGPPRYGIKQFMLFSSEKDAVKHGEDFIARRNQPISDDWYDDGYPWYKFEVSLQIV